MPLSFQGIALLTVSRLPWIKVRRSLLCLLHWGGLSIPGKFCLCCLLTFFLSLSLFFPSFLLSPLTFIAATVLWKSWNSTHNGWKAGGLEWKRPGVHSNYFSAFVFTWNRKVPAHTQHTTTKATKGSVRAYPRTPCHVQTWEGADWFEPTSFLLPPRLLLWGNRNQNRSERVNNNLTGTHRYHLYLPVFLLPIYFACVQGVPLSFTNRINNCLVSWY